MKKPLATQLLKIGLILLGLAYFGAAVLVIWVLLVFVDPQRVLSDGLSIITQNPQFIYILLVPVIHCLCGFLALRTAFNKNASDKKKLLTLGAGIILLGLLLFL
jgi:hypothetical protein